VLETAAVARDPAGGFEQVTTAIADRVARVLGVSSCRYVPGRLLDTRVPVLGGDGEVRRDGARLDVDSDGMPTTVEVAIVPSPPSEGYFVVSSGDRVVRPSQAQRRIAAHLADQLSSSVD
jgi:hypothetical protein